MIRSQAMRLETKSVDFLFFLLSSSTGISLSLIFSKYFSNRFSFLLISAAIAITPPEKTASPERETGVTGQTGGVTQFTLKIQEIIEAYPGTLEEQLKTLESDDTLQSTLEGDA